MFQSVLSAGGSLVHSLLSDTTCSSDSEGQTVLPRAVILYDDTRQPFIAWLHFVTYVGGRKYEYFSTIHKSLYTVFVSTGNDLRGNAHMYYGIKEGVTMDSSRIR